MESSPAQASGPLKNAGRFNPESKTQPAEMVGRRSDGLRESSYLGLWFQHDFQFAKCDVEKLSNGQAVANCLCVEQDGVRAVFPAERMCHQ